MTNEQHRKKQTGPALLSRRRSRRLGHTAGKKKGLSQDWIEGQGTKAARRKHILCERTAVHRRATWSEKVRASLGGRLPDPLSVPRKGGVGGGVVGFWGGGETGDWEVKSPPIQRKKREGLGFIQQGRRTTLGEGTIHNNAQQVERRT